ncbi:hypothetical protein SMD44_08916 [Streptomyces alboflavus]|uniref:Uncharacterized protein n=1 Tax=Streptomyces alboflavus TaxID=67267 RepID=A0A1Z1WSR9_9ACTN|nr:hypothetical protein SMD44_08916 [Streptomyces alboflavus]
MVEVVVEQGGGIAVTVRAQRSREPSVVILMARARRGTLVPDGSSPLATASVSSS